MNSIETLYAQIAYMSHGLIDGKKYSIEQIDKDLQEILEELEDKIESNKMIEFPSIYYSSFWNNWVVVYMHNDVPHSCVCTKEQAEKWLKELQNENKNSKSEISCCKN